MDVLRMLEEKVAMLVSLVKNIKEENTILQSNNESLKAEVSKLQSEVKVFAEENAQLMSRIESIENVALKESEQIKELSEKDVLTKMVVTDLIESIKSIDLLMKNELDHEQDNKTL